jgi:hypothetical protein
VELALALSGGTYAAAPECSTEAMKTVRYIAGGGLHVEAVAADATPQGEGLSGWEDTGDRFVAYRCIVAPRADGRWSGRATLVPIGWTIGSGDAERRVCRYAGSEPRRGIDANIAHPAEYVDVTSNLPAQNFLVVRGSQPCPAAADTSSPNAGLRTLQHQP